MAHRTTAALVAFLCMPGLTSCAAITLDLSGIEEPIMLNALPYAGADWTTTDVGEYIPDVSHATGVASDPMINADRGSDLYVDEAQVKAFEAIGGSSTRVIVIDRVEPAAAFGNLLIVAADLAMVGVYGRVVEIAGRAPIERQEQR